MTSVAGQIAVPGTVAYSASKTGITGLTRTLAVENVAKNITTNVLALGYMEVESIAQMSEELQEKIRTSIPMKRFGSAASVATAIRFLVNCDYITGTTININGGLYM